jgi:hypothetical protein
MFGFEEIGDEVDIAIVRDPLESRQLVQDNVLPDEIAVRGVLAASDLFFPPAIQAIPGPRFLANIRRRETGLFDDEILRFAVARVVLNPEVQAEATFDVPQARPVK